MDVTDGVTPSRDQELSAERTGRYSFDGDKRGIQPQHAQRIADILDRPDASVAVQDMSFPGSIIGAYVLPATGELHFGSKMGMRTLSTIKITINDIDRYDSYYGTQYSRTH